MHEFPCPTPITMNIKLAGGAADVYAVERETAAVEVEPYDDSSAAREAAERIHVELRGDTLVVECPTGSGWLSRQRNRVRVHAWVPIDSALNSSVASADVACHGRFAAVTANGASGDLRVEEVTGDLVVNTASGDVHAGRVGGRLQVDSASADVRAAYVGGDAKTDSASGDVEIDELGGGLSANTASGDLRVGVTRGGTVKVNSASGDVTIGVPAGTLAWLDLSSMSGSTHSDLAMTDGAEPVATGEAALNVQVRTMSGDIHVHRVAQPATTA
jgi:hypothetical protein